MICEPGEIYRVYIQGRGSGTVKVIRQLLDGLVDSTIEHGKFNNRVVKEQPRIDGDFLCFYPQDEGVKVKAIHGKA